MPGRAGGVSSQQLTVVTHDRCLRVVGHDHRVGHLPIRHGDREPRLTVVCVVGRINPERVGDVLPQRVVPVAVRRIEVAACVAGTTWVNAGGAVLLESRIELGGNCLVRGGPFRVAAAEDGVRQVFIRGGPRLAEHLMELDGIIWGRPL